MSKRNNNELTPCTCCGRHFRGSDCPFCGGAADKLTNSDEKSGSVIGGRAGAALLLAGALAASGCAANPASLFGLSAYGGPPLSDEEAREKLMGPTQQRRQDYHAYQKQTDETNMMREKQGLPPVPKLSYKDWVEQR